MRPAGPAPIIRRSVCIVPVKSISGNTLSFMIQLVHRHVIMRLNKATLIELKLTGIQSMRDVRACSGV